MNPIFVLALALGIGFVAGLRSMTAPAAVSWAAHLERLNMHGTQFAFMGYTVVVAILSLGAVGEYVADKLPGTPNRTSPGPLIARIVTGGFSGACVCASTYQIIAIGAVVGGIGAVIGAFAGYEARKRLVSNLKVTDTAVAVPEDLISIGLGILFVWLR